MDESDKSIFLISWHLQIFLRNIFPKNYWDPAGIPIDARDTKMIAREINEEEIPITSGVVIFDKIYQNA